jgi:hypothetical protein
VDLREKKAAAPASEPLEGEVWLGVSLASSFRLIIDWLLAASEPALAEPLIAATEAKLATHASPLWLSDGLHAYGAALQARHCVLQTFPRTGRPGRPRRPKLVAAPSLRYAQVMKQREERGRLVGASRRVVFGAVPLERVHTAYIERQNLNYRHENRRLTRKSIAFSKTVAALGHQLEFHQAHHNLVRPHRTLAERVDVPSRGRVRRRWAKRTPAMAAGLTDHMWTLRELMSRRILS